MEELVYCFLCELHENEPNFMVYCSICGKSVRKWCSLKKHLQRNHKEIVLETEIDEPALLYDDLKGSQGNDSQIEIGDCQMIQRIQHFFCSIQPVNSL